MLATTHSRYPGAQPFADDPLSRKLFFGRRKESLALRHQVLANRLTVLFARSGLGKTSLINAGISQNLREEGFLPLTVRVNDREQGPLASIYRGIADCCREQGIEYVPGNTESLWLFFKTAEFWVNDALLTPVLVLDQFEEIFTLQTDAQRNAFVDQFSFLVRGVRPDAGDAAPQAAASGAPPISDTPPAIRILIGIREDFLANLDDLSDRIPEILNERFRLLPLDRVQAGEALTEPALLEDPSLASKPFHIDPDCQRAVLDFLEQRGPSPFRAAASSIEPFQLQLICQHIEEIARLAQVAAGGQETTVSLAQIGGEKKLRNILKTFYQTQLLAVPWRQRSGVRRLCSELLINPQGRRLRLEESEIVRLAGVKPETLAILVERRLLRRDQTMGGDYYELSHDSLVAPVMNSRRFWFLAKAGLLLIPAMLAAVYGVYLLIFAIIVPFLEEFTFETALWAVPLSLGSAYVLGRFGVHKFREARDYLRRGRI